MQHAGTTYFPFVGNLVGVVLFVGVVTNSSTSTINGVTYLPWSDADLMELRKVSAVAQDYEDPSGLLRLSDKQKAQFGDWQRPYDLSEGPQMIHLISSFSIKQVCNSWTKYLPKGNNGWN